MRSCICNEFNGCVFNAGARWRLLWTYLEMFWPDGGGTEDHAESPSVTTLPSALVKNIKNMLGNKFLAHLGMFGGEAVVKNKYGSFFT